MTKPEKIDKPEKIEAAEAAEPAKEPRYVAVRPIVLRRYGPTKIDLEIPEGGVVPLEEVPALIEHGLVKEA